MGFDISHRDQFGFLRGNFDQGWFSYPIEVLPSVKPFLFPCRQCNRILFHVTAEQHAGIGVKLPFASKPLVSTGKAYLVLCNQCTTVNTQLTQKMTERLEFAVIPAQISNLYLQVCNKDSPAPYSEEYIRTAVELIPAERPDLRDHVGKLLRWYGLETTPSTLRESLCWACGHRGIPRSQQTPSWRG